MKRPPNETMVERRRRAAHPRLSLNDWPDDRASEFVTFLLGTLADPVGDTRAEPLGPDLPKGNTLFFDMRRLGKNPPPDRTAIKGQKLLDLICGVIRVVDRDEWFLEVRQ